MFDVHDAPVCSASSRSRSPSRRRRRPHPRDPEPSMRALAVCDRRPAPAPLSKRSRALARRGGCVMRAGSGEVRRPPAHPRILGARELAPASCPEQHSPATYAARPRERAVERLRVNRRGRRRRGVRESRRSTRRTRRRTRYRPPRPVPPASTRRGRRSRSRRDDGHPRFRACASPFPSPRADAGRSPQLAAPRVVAAHKKIIHGLS